MPTRRARVCLVAPEFIGPFPNGGVGTACYWEATTLGRAGFDVTVLYTGPTHAESAEHWERMFASAPFHYVDLGRWTAANAAAGTAPVRQPCGEAHTSELVSAFLRRHRFAVVLFQEFLGHGFRALQARHAGAVLTPDTVTAVTLHSCRQWIYDGMLRLPTSNDDLLVDALERESARFADVVAAPSRHMAEWIAARWSCAPSVVPYCYDEVLERSARVVTHEGPFTHLVFFGRLETRKGLHLLCRALAEHERARGPLKTVTFLGKSSSVEGLPSEEFIRSTLRPVADLDVRVINTMGSLEALEWLGQQRQTVVIAPSLADNLPYALIELFARRLPLLSTRIGGIPEIVGTANAHLLAAPTVDGLADLLSGVHQAGRLTIDYRDGYQIGAANDAHVRWVESLLKLSSARTAQARRRSAGRVTRAAVRPRLAPPCDVVVTDAASLTAVREKFVKADRSAAAARFLTWDAWRRSHARHPALFVSSDVEPTRHMVRRLGARVAGRGPEAVTSYFQVHGSMEICAPLGRSLEAGWATNVFGGPCLMARGRALDALRSLPAGTFHFWPAYAALTCAGVELAMVPEPLYRAAATSDDLDAARAVFEMYRTATPRSIDLGWLLKFAAARGASAPAVSDSAGRALYEQLTGVGDAQLRAWSGLTWDGAPDPYIADMRRLRDRLAAVGRDWDLRSPRVFVYGAGQHTRLVLTLAPELGAHIAGFIDRRPMAEFLGKPCIRPEQLSPSIADAVLYSSREFEHEMRAALVHVDVEHVTLYGDAAAAPVETTSSRVRRRMGHADAPIAGLREIYRPPSWMQGGCAHGDVEFLTEMITAVAPQQMLELGVASGTSSAAILFALDRLPGAGARRQLYSCDVRPTCYFDASRATGAAVAEIYPTYQSEWILDTNSDARRVRSRFADGSVDLCFIDANHSHPWPLLDLLHVAPLLRPGGWILLHDIELPRLHPQFQVHGPQWLFAAWPFNKIHGVGDSINIGAVQLPDRLEDLVPVARALLSAPWEHMPTTWDIALPEPFEDISRLVAPRLLQPAVAV